MSRPIDLSKLQDAVGELLASDASVTALLGDRPGRIQGATRSDVSLPFISIGDSDSLDQGVQGLAAQRVRFNCHIFTAEDGFDLSKQIEGAVVAAMDDNAFAVAEHRVVSCFHEESRFFRDPMEGVRHAVVEFDIQIEPFGFIRAEVTNTITVFVDGSGTLGIISVGNLEETIDFGLSAFGTIIDGNLATGPVEPIEVEVDGSGTVADGITGVAVNIVGIIDANGVGFVDDGIQADASEAIGEITATASGTIADGISGSTSEAIGEITVVGSGNNFTPIDGDTTEAIGEVTATAAGTVADGITGTTAETITPGSDASGTIADGITGDATEIIGVIDVTGSGSLNSGINASLDSTVEVFVTSTAVVTDGIQGNSTDAIGEVTVSADGDVANGVTGDATEVLGEIGVTASGDVENGVTGDANQSIGEITVDGSGTLATGPVGTATNTVEILGEGSGTVADGLTGNSLESVGEILSVSSATVADGITGDTSEAIGEVTSTASGELTDNITSSTTQSIGEVDSASSGTIADGITAIASESVGEVTSTSDGTVSASNEAETDALLAQMANTQTTARITAINDLMKVMVDEGIFTQLGWFSIIGADDDASLRNWIVPTETLSQENNAVIVHDAYFDTKSNPSGNGGFVTNKEVQNVGGAALADFTFGVYFVKLDELGQTRSSRLTDNNTWFRCDFSAPIMRNAGVSHPNTYASRVVNDPYHMTMVHRGTGSADREAYYQGVSFDTQNGAGGSLSVTSDVDLIGTVTKDSDERILCAYFGRALTSAQVLSLHNAIEDYKTAIGA